MTPVPVLLFHAVLDDGDAWAVTPRRFTEHLQRVLACGRTPVTVAELSRRLRAGESLDRLVAVSFDDGEASQLAAATELAEAGVPSSVYVTMDYVDRPGMLDGAQLRALADVPGIDLGSHSVHHVHLDVLSGADARRELRDSKAALEDVVQRPVLGVAYPHGSHDRGVLRATEEAGYVSGAAVRNALSHDGEHPLSVSRLTVTMATEDQQVERFLRGEGRLGEVRPRLRTRGFRVYRKLRHRVSGRARG